MKIVNHIFGAVMVSAMLLVGSAAAQERGDLPNDGPGQDNSRARMLRQLGLVPRQLQEIRRINVQRKPMMERAQMRLRQATRALDEAIYADEVDEAVVQERLKQMQMAQGEVFRIRFTSELAIRRLLTPEQLVRFRNMRQRFEQIRNGDQPRADARRSQDGASQPTDRTSMRKPE